MADEPSNLTSKRIIDSDANSSTPAITSEEFRNSILSRNLFNSSNSYEDNTLASKINAMGISLNSVLEVIPQYPIGVKNSLLSRAGAAVGGLLGGGSLTSNMSNLEKIGTQMLAKQMFFNSVSHVAQNYLGSIDIKGALRDGNLYQKPIDYSITKNNGDNLLDKITSAIFFKTNIIGSGYPFNEKSNNIEYIKNTGKAQLSKFYQAINYNLYKPISKKDGSDGKELLDIADKYNIKITTQKEVLNNRHFFNFDEKYYNSYLAIDSNKIDSVFVGIANKEMMESFSDSNDSGTFYMYAPDIDYVNSYFGRSDKTPDSNIEDNLNYFNIDRNNINNKLIWGRDGISENTKTRSEQYHGDDDKKILDHYYNDNQNTNIFSNFNVKRGILEYTKNLVNATSGQFIDLTRKVFVESSKLIGFNGSPLWKSNNSEYAEVNGTNNKKGLRQHTIIDQYDRYDKAIRFTGNKAYGGNENSVIYESVIPRIHPTLDAGENDINNKNLMFSIENLAVRTIKRENEGYGVIDDEYGSPIPLSEVGPFMGRIMWFPPYDLQLNETAIAKYESTVMIGRNEPMYSYINSERTATLSFKLIVDYPPHLRSYIGNLNYKKNIADFFAFGGDMIPEVMIDKSEEWKKALQTENNSNNKNQIEINEKTFYIFFPNDLPRDGEVETIIDDMYKMSYEILKNCKTNYGNSDGLNDKIYFITGLTRTTTGSNTYELNLDDIQNSNFSQYNVGSEQQQSDINPSINSLNDFIKKNLSDVNTRKLYKIIITGKASKLYEIPSKEEEYNYNLGLRRAKAAEHFIKERIKAVLKINDTNDIHIDTRSTGSYGQSKEGAIAENMNNTKVKIERCAVIQFVKNDKSDNNSESDSNISNNSGEINKSNEQTKKNGKLKEGILFKSRTLKTKAIFDTFESSYGNYYYPAFQSQTPEDFHRRLTFLQQCTRQGAANRYAMQVDNTGVLRAKNSVFGRQPICILRIGDFFYTKVIIDNVTIDYNDTTWDMNPEGMGVQPMIAKVTLQMKVIGGQSLKGPIDALQNAVSFNYYANSTYYTKGMYKLPNDVSENQMSYIEGILNKNIRDLNETFDKILKSNQKLNTNNS